jgi:hypothetical protein
MKVTVKNAAKTVYVFHRNLVVKSLIYYKESKIKDFLCTVSLKGRPPFLS